MYLTQLYTSGIAQCSYLIGGSSECVVVDPTRDVEKYIRAASDYSLKITAIIETHLHADFVSGHMDLARATGARIYATASGGCAFDHSAVKDGDEFAVDNILFRVMDTPGHTPEGGVFVVSDLTRGTEPALAFTGDTLLVGDVGRPDLFPSMKEDLTEKLFASIERLKRLGDNIEVYPAHGAGSLCGRSLSAKLSTTIGTEKMHNYALKAVTTKEFAYHVLQDMPDAPDHFVRCSEINRRGPAVVSDLPAPRAVSPAEFKRLIEQGHVVVDTRDQLPLAGAYIAGSYSVSLKSNYATFAGWALPPDKPLLLVVDDLADLREAHAGLLRVGLDNIVGYLDGGLTDWVAEGYEADHVGCLSIPELARRVERSDIQVFDTRMKGEYQSGHIRGAIHVAAPDMRHYEQIPDDKDLAVICSSGNRSMLAATLLKRRGYHRVYNVAGGMTAWKAAGHPVDM